MPKLMNFNKGEVHEPAIHYKKKYKTKSPRIKKKA